MTHPPQISTPPATAALAPTRAWVGLGVLVLAVTLLAIDGTVLALAIPSLAADLGATATQLLWVGDIYSLVLAGLLVTMGNVADRFGRKRVLLIGATVFGLASAVGAFAPNAEVLIAARAVLGIAGATIMPSTLSLIRSMFHDRQQRTRAIALWAAGASGGAALGPLVGGALLENFWWGSVFLINIPVMLVLLALGIPLLPESRHPSPGRFDLTSAGLSIAGAIALVYAVKTVAKDGFTLQFAIALIVGVGGLVVFVRRQRTLDFPLIDVGLFKSKPFTGAIMGTFVAVFAMSGLLFFFSQYLQLVEGHSPLEAGLRELPLALAMIVVPVFAGVAAKRLGVNRAVGIGLGLAAVGLAVIAVAEDSGTYTWIAVGLAVIGLGAGLAYTLTTDVVVGAVPASRAGAASAISESAYEFGIAVGIAVMGSIQAAAYTANVRDLDLPADIAHHAEDSLAGALGVITDPATVESLQHAFVAGMQVTLYTGAGLLLVAAVLGWRLIRPDQLTNDNEHHEDAGSRVAPGPCVTCEHGS
ncbi:MFS transporter [Rhodococcus triatomae]